MRADQAVVTDGAIVPGCGVDHGVFQNDAGIAEPDASTALSYNPRARLYAAAWADADAAKDGAIWARGEI